MTIVIERCSILYNSVGIVAYHCNMLTKSVYMYIVHSITIA